MNTGIFILIAAVIVIAFLTALLYMFTEKMLKNDRRKIAITLVMMLVAQFILGMINNFYVTIPKVKSYEVYHHFGPVSLHTALALFLLIFSLFYTINAYKSHVYRGLSIVGVTSIVIATVSGVSFVNSAGENDVYSLIMAIGFIVAFLVYTYAAFTKDAQ